MVSNLMENSPFLSQHDGAGASTEYFNMAPPSDQMENCASEDSSTLGGHGTQRGPKGPVKNKPIILISLAQCFDLSDSRCVINFLPFKWP